MLNVDNLKQVEDITVKKKKKKLLEESDGFLYVCMYVGISFFPFKIKKTN